MSLSLPKTCSMGGNKTGLVGTIGVTLLNPDGTTHTARATADIYEIGGGCYGKNITFEDNWKGAIMWNTGGGSPVYAVEEYDIEGIVDSIEEDTNELQGLITSSKIAAQVKGMDSDVLTAAAIAADAIGSPEFAQAAADKVWVAATRELTTPSDYKADVSALALESGGKIEAIGDDTKRILGLIHENIYIDNPSFDINNNLTSARLRIYSIAGSVGTDSNVLATYTITAVGNGTGKFTSWKMVKE